MIIFIGFVLLFTVLLWGLIYARGPWWSKLAVTVVTLSFTFLVWGALGSYRGWPAPLSLPSNAVFISCEVNEPDAVSNDPGAIYLWLIPAKRQQDLVGYHSSRYEPRAYKEHYSEELASACDQASKMSKTSPTGVGLHTVRSSAKIHGVTRGQSSAGEYHPYLLPPPAIPRKGAR